MGAFSIDAPAGHFLRNLKIQCSGIAVVIFVLIGSVGLLLSLNHYRRIAERETAKDRAEAASRAKSNFLATMSHELRTPLNAIIGFSDMMVSEVLGKIANRQYYSYAVDINDSGGHLLQIINDILDLSKAESGKLDLDENIFDLLEVLRSVRQLTDRRIAACGLTVTLNLPSEMPPLRADERKTKQVLLNLISNAMKFTPEGGVITISGHVDRETGFILTVRDTGIGIDRADIGRVLEPFEQVDSSLSRRHQGTGLGLPLVRAIMELHGGTFELTSSIGCGTQATVTFPPERLVYDLAGGPLQTAA